MLGVVKDRVRAEVSGVREQSKHVRLLVEGFLERLSRGEAVGREEYERLLEMHLLQQMLSSRAGVRQQAAKALGVRVGLIPGEVGAGSGVVDGLDGLRDLEELLSGKRGRA